MLNEKAAIVLLIVGLIKKDIMQMSEYFLTPISFGRRVKIELDLSNYATKAGLKMKQMLIHQNLLKRLIKQA